MGSMCSCSTTVEDTNCDSLFVKCHSAICKSSCFGVSVHRLDEEDLRKIEDRVAEKVLAALRQEHQTHSQDTELAITTLTRSE